MLDANIKYQRAKMNRENVAEFKAQQKSQRVFNWVAVGAVVIGTVMMLSFSFATVAAVIGGA